MYRCSRKKIMIEKELEMENQKVIIRVMTMEDFDEVHALWVAVADGKIVGAILCGHDGRRGCLYHVCVREAYRKHGIGQKLVQACLEALKSEQINKVNLIAFKKNEVGNRFWQGLGWTFREDVNYYECIINEDNVTIYNP